MSRANDSWEWNGLSLNTRAWDVRALGAEEQVPPRRNENIVVPHRTGRTSVQKFIDERVYPLAGFVKGCDSNLGGAMSGSALWTNLDTLRASFAIGQTHTLKCKNAAGTTRLATAEIQQQVSFVPQGPDHYAFVVEFVMADPWWYAETATTVGPTTLTSSPQNVAVTNSGTYQAEKPTVTITGAITNPMLAYTWNTTSCWVKYTGVVASGETLTVNCNTFTATLGTVDVSGNMSHDGAIWWLVLPTGVNTVTVTGSALGTAAAAPTITISFTAAYV